MVNEFPSQIKGLPSLKVTKSVIKIISNIEAQEANNKACNLVCYILIFLNVHMYFFFCKMRILYLCKVCSSLANMLSGCQSPFLSRESM